MSNPSKQEKAAVWQERQRLRSVTFTRLLWSPNHSRLNSPGASIDLGCITLEAAQKLAWLHRASLVMEAPVGPPDGFVETKAGVWDSDWQPQASASGASANTLLPLPLPDEGKPAKKR